MKTNNYGAPPYARQSASLKASDGPSPVALPEAQRLQRKTSAQLPAARRPDLETVATKGAGGSTNSNHGPKGFGGPTKFAELDKHNSKIIITSITDLLIY